MTVVGVDIGGTGIKAVRSLAPGAADRAARIPTPYGDGATVADAVARLVAEVADGADIDAVGVGAPGIVDETAGVVVRSTNLDWTQVPLRELLERRIGSPLAFGHDVRLGGLAEFELGAGRGAADAVFLPIGTGISLAIRADGRSLVAGGRAGEIGLARVGDGTLEDAASATGLARRLGVADGAEVVARVRAGDPAARGVWDTALEALTDVLGAALLGLGTRRLVVGGGLAGAGELLLDPLRAGLERRMGPDAAPEVVPAALGDLAACHGAALLAARYAG